MNELTASLLIPILLAYGLLRWMKNRPRLGVAVVSAAVLGIGIVLCITGITEYLHFARYPNQEGPRIVAFWYTTFAVTIGSLALLIFRKPFGAAEDYQYVYRQVAQAGIWIASIMGTALLATRAMYPDAFLLVESIAPYDPYEPDVIPVYRPFLTYGLLWLLAAVATVLVLLRRWQGFGTSLGRSDVRKGTGWRPSLLFLLASGIAGGAFAAELCNRTFGQNELTMAVVGAVISFAVICGLMLAFKRYFKDGITLPSLVQIGMVCAVSAYLVVHLFAHHYSKPYFTPRFTADPVIAPVTLSIQNPSQIAILTTEK